MTEQLTHGAFEIASMYDAVEHAVIEQELRRLESFRQILAERLLDDARAGETDHRTRLRENRVAEHGVARAHATSCGIRQDRDIRNATLGELRENSGDLRHLHERQQ